VNDRDPEQSSGMKRKNQSGTKKGRFENRPALVFAILFLRVLSFDFVHDASQLGLHLLIHFFRPDAQNQFGQVADLLVINGLGLIGQFNDFTQVC
jgi:hypothetical protein